jgi:hypothetical protein
LEHYPLTTTLHKDIRFLAVEHNDHTPNRHVHAIFLISGKLSRQEFRVLATFTRQSATAEARRQRKTRDLYFNHPQIRTLVVRQPVLRAAPQVRRVRPSLWQGGCRSCGYGELTGIPKFYSYCPSCYARLKKDHQLALSLEDGG